MGQDDWLINLIRRDRLSSRHCRQGKCHDELSLSLQDTKYGAPVLILVLKSKAVHQVKNHAKNVHKLWGFINDQTGDYELQRLFAMRESLFTQTCRAFHQVYQLQERYQTQF